MGLYSDHLSGDAQGNILQQLLSDFLPSCAVMCLHIWAGGGETELLKVEAPAASTSNLGGSSFKQWRWGREHTHLHTHRDNDSSVSLSPPIQTHDDLDFGTYHFKLAGREGGVPPPRILYSVITALQLQPTHTNKGNSGQGLHLIAMETQNDQFSACKRCWWAEQPPYHRQREGDLQMKRLTSAGLHPEY